MTPLAPHTALPAGTEGTLLPGMEVISLTVALDIEGIRRDGGSIWGEEDDAPLVVEAIGVAADLACELAYRCLNSKITRNASLDTRLFAFCSSPQRHMGARVLY